ncbi:amino acid transporter [Striga asiatica]|uniref:Amino acid transporter n=1 Tax=Striga asiatica TaxID=4170 RepID=A0A5A7P261_STRAF|nr:amino acid transporter [Striga asiatica]
MGGSAQADAGEICLEKNDDAGASFVLQSKGEWWHAGFHLTTAVVGPTILTLPYAFRGLGWVPGFLCLTVIGAVTFYSYYLMSLVLDHREKGGRRHIRFRELAADVLGSGWMFYLVIFIQTAINIGICIGVLLFAGECLQIMYMGIYPESSLKLYHFIMVVTVLMMLMSQFPSFHSLRHINLGSLLLSMGYTFLVVVACISAGTLTNAPQRDYSLEVSESSRLFTAFNSISILAAIFGNGNVGSSGHWKNVSGYWVFGNKSNSNILKNLMSDEGPPLAPVWVLGLAIIFILLQLFAIGLVYSQVVYEIIEKKSAGVNRGIFSIRNLIPRIILRSLYVTVCGSVAAMLPFFGDISAIVGAVGFIPLDFVLPMLMYNMTHKPTKKSLAYWVNSSIIIVFTCVGLMGAFSSTRKLVLDAKEFKLFSNEVVD